MERSKHPAAALRGLALALVALLGGGVTAEAAPRDVVYTGSGCTEAFVTLPVLEGDVAELVPPPFTVSAEGGVAEVAIGFVRCERISLAGGPARPGMVSEVGIQIEPPDGGVGSHVYSLWQVNDRADLRKALARLGMTGGRARTTFHLEEVVGPAVTIESDIPWGPSPYSLEATGIEPPSPLGTSIATWWHSGPKGIVRFDYGLTSLELSGASGTLYSEEGTVLHGLTRASARPTPVFLYRFDFSARVRLVRKLH